MDNDDTVYMLFSMTLSGTGTFPLYRGQLKLIHEEQPNGCTADFTFTAAVSPVSGAVSFQIQDPSPPYLHLADTLPEPEVVDLQNVLIQLFLLAFGKFHVHFEAKPPALAKKVAGGATFSYTEAARHPLMTHDPDELVALYRLAQCHPTPPTATRGWSGLEVLAGTDVLLLTAITDA